MIGDAILYLSRGETRRYDLVMVNEHVIAM